MTPHWQTGQSPYGVRAIGVLEWFRVRLEQEVVRCKLRSQRSVNFRIVIHPLFGPECGIDVTESVVRAIADEIGRRYEGNRVLNRLEAEALLVDFLDRYAQAPDGEEG